MKKLYLLFIPILIILSACSSSSFDEPVVLQNNDGITVSLKKDSRVKKIRLQVVNDNIIHVMATPEDEFSKRESLIATHSSGKPDWSYKANDDNTIELLTSAISAKISLTTGEIAFAEKSGKVILKENIGGGKTFQAMEIDGEKAWSMRQVFESPDDEAFYGLGQHQSDEFNYKGKNETLFQYNTKVSVPFVVSNKNYGILWDNYSLTRFGDPREYSQLLDLFNLYDKDGHEGGLTATYMENGDPENIFAERRESTIDYENLETVKNFPDEFPFYNSEIIWEGLIEPSESGIFRFILYYAGYTKVYLDDELVVAERWRTAWNPNSYKFEADLKKGTKHKLKIEWKPDGGISYIGLKALSPVDPIEQGKLSFWSEMGDQIDYYFIHGNSPDEVISGYRAITGKAQVMPKWSMGFWQSRERYKTQQELIDVLKEFRRRKIPIDNIVQDWSYWPEDAWGSHDFDPNRFPDPQAMVDAVHKMKARIMISVWPKFYYTTEHYKQFDEKGWMYRRAVQDSVRDWIGKGYIGSFYDAYSEGARQLFWDQMEDKLYKFGFDAWWMDASEPDILSNASMDYRKQLMSPTALGSSTRYFNAYGLVNAKGIYEGQRATNNDNRVFLLTRSGFAGSQKYGAVIWSGDIGTRWEDMKAQISAGLNFSISGNPYWTMDNGGFCVERRYEIAKEGSEDLDEWRELNTRWHQFGAFVPIFRSHGQYPYREMWNIAPNNHPAYKSMLKYNYLRYQLMPYIYSLYGYVYLNDYTIMRPLIMDFGNDGNVLDISDQYMFGPSIMVCPVYEYKTRSRKVYFPAGQGWYDFATDKFVTNGGNTLEVNAPYEDIPLYVPAGSVIPMSFQIESTKDERSELVLKIYAGKDGRFLLYEDEGTNYDYEKGSYSIIPFYYNDADKTLTVENRENRYDQMYENRIIIISYITKNGSKLLSLTYDGSEQKISLR